MRWGGVDGMILLRFWWIGSPIICGWAKIVGRCRVECSGVGDSVLQMGREELGLGLDWGPCS
jgi:TM2 domain-containing membrane protein YozV